jgi:ElaB/YqjD/DUF883 family membrane-anchored ribosome-binding protein
MNNSETAVKQVKEDLNDLSQEAVNKTEHTFDKIKEKVSEQIINLQDKTQFAKEKVSDNLSGAADVVHTKADQTQEFLDNKTDNFNAIAHQTIEKVNELGHRAGDVLNTSSEYVRNFDAEQTRQQVKEKIQNNPGISLAVAGVFGLIIGLLIGRNNKSR